MTELQLKTVNLTPAKIEFNKKAILDELDGTLSKYKNLVFSEDNTAEIRRTLADLRKGKTAADQFRLANKKKAIAPVTAFENEVKEIIKKFDDVINPIDDQLKEFEDNRRSEKLAELEEIRLEHIKNHDLNAEYHDQVTITDNMLTKGVSLNQAGESLEFMVKNLKMEQDKKAADRELIITTVKLANSENDLGFSADAYVRLLDFKPVEVIKNQIKIDAEREVEKRREKERLEQERIERERVAKERAEQERIEREKQAEQERLEQEENKRVEQEKKAEQERIEQEKQEEPQPRGISQGRFIEKVVEEVLEVELPFSDPFEDDPFSTFEDDPFEETAITNKVYKVYATESEQGKLNNFLELNGYDFEVIN